MSHRARRALVAGLVPVALAVALAGCGSEKEPAAGGSSSASSSSSSSTTTEAKEPSASDLYSKARATALAAESAHIQGEMTNKGVTLVIDLAGQVDGTNQSMEVGPSADTKVTLLTVGGKNYLSASESFWTQQVGAAVAAKLTDKFVILPDAQAKGFGDLRIRSLLTEMFEDKGMSVLQSANAKVEKTTIDGADAWQISDKVGSDGAAMVVSADEKATILRIIGPKDSPGTLDFSEWDKVPAVQAPAKPKLIELPK